MPGFDIDERVAERLRESEQRFRRLLALSSDWYWEQNEDFVFTSVFAQTPKANERARAAVGKRRWEIPCLNMTDASWEAHRALLAARQPFHELELSRLDAAGEPLWVSTTGEPVFDAAGTFKGYRGIARDITDRRRAEHALRESEQRFQVFMDNLPAVAWVKDSAFRYTYLNSPFEKMVGKGPRQMMGRTDFEVDWPEGGGEITRRSDLAVLQAQRPLQAIESGLHPDGGVHHWLNVKFPLPDATGEPGVAGVAIDITERVNAQEEARRSSQQIKTLYVRLMATHESERRKLATGLHDLIGQNLTALGIDLAHLKAALSAAGHDLATSRIDSMAALLEQTIDSVRGVMAELRPPALEEYGLVPALHWYASVVAGRTGIEINVTAGKGRLPRDMEVALFRIAQEAVTNALKHSQGRAVEIGVHIDERAVRLTVTDDGTGFADPVGARAAQRGGWGLPTMRERAVALGGTLRVEFPERGTRLVVEIPLTHADQHPAA